MQLYDVVAISMYEFPVLIDYYVRSGLTKESNISVAGLLIGGMTTNALLVPYKMIHSVVVLMDCPSSIVFSKWILKRINKMEPQ